MRRIIELNLTFIGILFCAILMRSIQKETDTNSKLFFLKSEGCKLDYGKSDHITVIKKYLFISLMILSGCSQNIGNLSIASIRPTNISNEYESIGLIQGESTIFVASADKMPRINDPIQNALNISGADLITNATFELETYLFMKIIKVKGEGWVKKKDGNIIETQRKKKIVAYDPETGEPIYE